MKSPEGLFPRILAFPMAASVLLGATACGKDEVPGAKPSSGAHAISGCNTIGDLDNLRLIGANKTGGVNAVAGSDCVDVYDGQGLDTIGIIRPEQAFVILCNPGLSNDRLHKGTLLVELPGKLRGTVALGETISPDQLSNIPVC